MIERVDETQLETLLPELVLLLQDAVDDGASIGFLPPLSNAEAKEYWQKVQLQMPIDRAFSSSLVHQKLPEPFSLN